MVLQNELYKILLLFFLLFSHGDLCQCVENQLLNLILASVSFDRLWYFRLWKMCFWDVSRGGSKTIAFFHLTFKKLHVNYVCIFPYNLCLLFEISNAC